MKKDLSLETAKAILGVSDSDLGANTKSVLNNSFEGKGVRTFGFKGEVCFVAKDVVELLGYKNSSKTIGDHCRKSISLDELIRGNESLPLLKALNLGTNGKKIKIIKQGDVLRLIVKSKLPNAEKIESWIFDTVIPKVLDTGSFSVNDEKLREENLKLKAMLKSKDAEIDRVRQSIESDTLNKVIEGDGQHIYRIRRSTMAIHTLEEFAKKIFRQRDEDLSSQHTLYQEFKAKKVNKYQYFINEVRTKAQGGIQMLQHLINNLNPHKIQDLKVQANTINIKRELIENLNQLKEGKNLEISQLEDELKRWIDTIDSRNQTKMQSIEDAFKSQMAVAEKEYFEIAREKHALALKVRESNDTKGIEAQHLLMLLTF